MWFNILKRVARLLGNWQCLWMSGDIAVLQSESEAHIERVKGPFLSDLEMDKSLHAFNITQAKSSIVLHLLTTVTAV